jgi:RNA polymerase sigma-70 factor (ECF subfamily)
LKLSTTDASMSVYHYLAAISAYHCSAATWETTDWVSILDIYDRFIILDRSAIVRLNRSIALSMVKGAKAALDELSTLDDVSAIKTYSLYYSSKAEFQIELQLFNEALESLEKARELAGVSSEKKMIETRLHWCRKKIIGR